MKCGPWLTLISPILAKGALSLFAQGAIQRSALFLTLFTATGALLTHSFLSRRQSKPSEISFALAAGLFCLSLFSILPSEFGFNLQRLSSPILYASLFLMSSGLLVLRDYPFTLAYVLDQDLPSEIASSHELLITMKELAWAWSALFLTATVFACLPSPAWREGAPLALLLVAGPWFSKRYPRTRMRHLLNQKKGMARGP